MSFTKKVYEKALAACGRRCCICHVFCGKNIELHHIVQKADGGPDSFDNAIPLCLKCHADMGKTDPHHPKGRSYTENELRMHRDHWYEIVKSGINKWDIQQTKTNDEEKNDYCARYRKLRFEVACALVFYANVYTDIVEKTDERHEKASEHLRKVGAMLKAFASEAQPEDIDIPNVGEINEAGGLFIGLSNRLYSYKGGDSYRLLDINIQSEDRIKDIFKIYNF